jgi:hypothetical protein
MPEFAYTVTEHDPQRPWLIVAQSRGAVTLDDPAAFFEWVAEHWPGPRWTVELDPWQLAPETGPLRTVS